MLEACRCTLHSSTEKHWFVFPLLHPSVSLRLPFYTCVGYSPEIHPLKVQYMTFGPTCTSTSISDQNKHARCFLNKVGGGKKKAAPEETAHETQIKLSNCQIWIFVMFVMRLPCWKWTRRTRRDSHALTCTFTCTNMHARPDRLSKQRKEKLGLQHT